MTSTNTNETASVTFADLGLSEDVLAAVRDMGYTEPTPVQAASIPHALDGEDVLAAAQTGTGKTAAFLLPTMNNLPHVPRSRGRKGDAAQGPLMLVVTPTRELAQQIEAVCTAVAKRTGHRSVTVVGGVSYNPQKEKLRRGCDILIATPGRLEDLINQEACRLDQVQVLLLDEADRMLDMGFLPAVRRIVSQTRDDRQTLLFSATLDEGQVGSITDLVRDPARVEIAPVTSTADTVEQFVCPVSPEAKNALLIDVLKREGAHRSIVFCRTKHRADACSRRLARAGITCAAIHGDRSQAQRERALKAFRAGSCDVLVATDVLARGIDISDVRYVVNFDVPGDPVDYIHRIGRTGRAGEEGWSVTFVTDEDIAEFFDIEALMGKTADLFDVEGLDLGAHAPEIDPERIPAKAPAGKKEKKRRRKATARKKERVARGDAPKQGATGDAVHAEPATPKPSRRKRGGKTRVHGDEGADFELLSAREARGGRATAEKAEDRAGRSRRRSERSAGERDGRGRSDSRGRGEARSSSKKSGRAGLVNGRKADGERTSREGRDAWRNYDEVSERRGRGRAARTKQMTVGRGSAQKSQASRSSRRPGDHGGRR
ncbi:MAG: DEAD/DEAH box helicase [Coriobacteriaceae bacterium]|nr:DEAD/DEAH box helicase [Coriobacteriaceae bacterium]